MDEAPNQRPRRRGTKRATRTASPSREDRATQSADFDISEDEDRAESSEPPIGGAEVQAEPAAAREEARGGAARRDAAQPERVPMLGDAPAEIDELARRPFAEVLGHRIDQVRLLERERRADESEPGSAFMVQIHGRWGSGKTSILNLLKSYLQDPERPRDQQWVVIEFNAWQQQRIRPPWWALITAICTQSMRQLDFTRASVLRVRWLLWRMKADWVPTILAILLISVSVLAVSGVAGFSSSLQAPNSASLASAMELSLKVIVALSAAAAAIFTFSRSIVFGSARAAQTYADMRTDPLQPIVLLFRKLVSAVRRPVVVFIDDLDRCDSKYVVELLEGIQTLFRSAPVTYVVAADRKWISSSFDRVYEDFGSAIGEPGRPLGYLFLDKLFQVSAAVPRLSWDLQRRYWNNLLNPLSTSELKDAERRRKEAERKAWQQLSHLHTHNELQEKIRSAIGDPLLEQAMRAAAARQITSKEARREQEHRLQSFAEFLEPNPRSMKRLVNAYGLHQATHLIEGREVTPESLALWTILELRWPLLADFLADCPQYTDNLGKGTALQLEAIPGNLRLLFTDPAVRRVVAGKGSASLDECAVRQILGLPQPDEDVAPPAPSSIFCRAEESKAVADAVGRARFHPS